MGGIFVLFRWRMKLIVQVCLVWSCVIVLCCGQAYVYEANPSVEAYMGTVFPIYVVPMEFGTPPQQLNILLDGGLDLFLLFTTNCTQYGCGLQTFDPESSSSLVYTSYSLNYTYAAGNLNVIGQIASDNGTFGNEQDQKQLVGLVNNLTQPGYYPPSNPILSGVLGFAYPSEQYGAMSIVMNFCETQGWANLMSLWLPMNIYDTGAVTFNQPSEDFYTGSLNYVPLLPSTWADKDFPFFWSNIISDIKINGVSNGYCKRRTCNFFVDLAGRPMDLANAIPKINVSPDCSNIDQLDTYTFTIGGMDYTLNPEDYVVQYLNDNDQIQCESGITGGAKIPYPFTLGYTWIRNFYTVLDFDNQRLGFAPSKK